MSPEATRIFNCIISLSNRKNNRKVGPVFLSLLIFFISLKVLTLQTNYNNPDNIGIIFTMKYNER